MTSPQNDLVWLPFEFKEYHLDCQVLNLFSNDTKRKKHFLLFIRRHRNLNDCFEGCPLQFNSEVVVYYQHNLTESLSGIRFEEIYKINQRQRKLSRNILGENSPISNGMNTDGLKRFIWKRRSNLKGVNFNAITEVAKPMIMNLEASKNPVENHIVYPIGYFPDIMNNLMSTLNFTIITTLTSKRYSFTYLLEMVRNGEYDIGYQGFVQTKLRTDRVDFSYGIIPTSWELFYVKQSRSFRFDVFLRSFYVGAWNVLALCGITLISGYTIIALLVEPQTSSLSLLRTVISLFKTATNITLRMFIGKRMSTEPT
jgi:hypothetical protein